MEQVVLNPGKLLNDKGNLEQAGYATSLVKEYDRAAIKAGKGRIKEWDYYYIGNKDYGIALTIADNSYMALFSISFLDLKNNKSVTKSIMKWFTYGKTGLPSTSATGNVKVSGNGYLLDFQNDGKIRHIECGVNNLYQGANFECCLDLVETNGHSMVIATPFDKDKHFYYNQKINCLKATGSFKYNGQEYTLDNSYGVLDWGRGVWTYKNTWYWSSANGEVDGTPFGFNLGYGFGNTSAASENMLFVGTDVYKLNDVKFEIPQNEKGKNDFMSPWKFTSSDGSIDLTFVPDHDRYSGSNVIIIKSIQHQVFGKFSGTFNVDGKKFEIKDFPGFAEKVRNCW